MSTRRVLERFRQQGMCVKRSQKNVCFALRLSRSMQMRVCDRVRTYFAEGTTRSSLARGTEGYKPSLSRAVRRVVEMEFGCATDALQARRKTALWTR
jgi:hypothetical protein